MNLYLVTLLCLSLERGVRLFGSQSFIYQKDMSEYCRRQVISSVFLGRHVTEAHSQILHFSQLELPYSCSISIRAEPGSNIVLVVEMKNVTEASDFRAGSPGCQVLVYELGETFGGYWGALPKEIMQNTPSTDAHAYTLHTTSEIPPESSDEDDIYVVGKGSASKGDTVPKSTGRPRNQQDGDADALDIQVEVPLVEVSGILVDNGNKAPEKVFPDESFDVIYDVAPRPGEEFSTSTILPLLQYSIHRENGRRLGETEKHVTEEYLASDGKINYAGAGGSTAPDVPRYAIDYKVFTPDSRLKYQFLERILSGKEKKVHNKGEKFNANKILKFRKKNGPTHRGKNFFQTIYPEDNTHHTSNKNIKNKINTTPSAEESKFMDELIKALNIENFEEHINTNQSQLLGNISNMHHNISVYLAPDLSIYNYKQPSSETEKIDWGGINVSTVSTPVTHTHATQAQQLTTRSKEKGRVLSEINVTADKLSSNVATKINIQSTVESSTSKKSSTHGSTQILESTTIFVANTSPTDKTIAFLGDAATKHRSQLQKHSSSTKNPNRPIPLHMVNRESFENIVQAAPKLADVLNKTYFGENLARDSVHRKRRRKRLIQAIDIESARPHSVTIRPDTKLTTKPYYMSDKQDFVQLVELQDDEVNGRVALRHADDYVGNILLNVCNAPVQKSRQVFLFNTSRILLVLNRFTVKRMTLVVTAARTMSSHESSCPELFLECQVSGARVCIDSMCACDGVPNCGSYDVYDEDRLLCKKGNRAPQSVYLAAFAFLAVLFTALYIVHYWLRRCVPKVSDAFFIYTDGTENILYLDSIMRSPGDQDDELLYNSHIFPGDIMMDELQSDIEELSKWEQFKSLFPCYRKKRDFSIVLETLDQINPALLSTTASQQRRLDIFSLAEADIIKFGHTMTDEITQTGESLEIKLDEEKTEKEESGMRAGRRKTNKYMKVPLAAAKDEEQYRDSELSMLKIMREARGPPRRQVSAIPDVPTQGGSRVRQSSRSVSVSKERELQSTLYDSKLNVDSLSSFIPEEGPFMKSRISAQARKHLRFNENLMIISSDEEDDVNVKQRQSAHLGTGRPTELKDEKVQEYSAARDFKRFWSSKKGNKKKKEEPKKKNQSSLR